MSKLIKIISIILLMCTIMLVFSNLVNANEDINAGEVFKDNNYYCVELGQQLSGTHNYTTMKTLTFDSGINKEFLKGLAYILSYDKYNPINRNRGEVHSESGHYIGYSSSEDPIQLALWRYIKDYENTAKEAFGFNLFNPSWNLLEEGTLEGRKYLKRKDAYRYINGNPTNDKISYTKSFLAPQIYEGAKTAMNSNDNWEFSIECLQHNNNQNIIKVNSIKKQEPVITELEINKKDSLTGEKVSGAKFTITLNNISYAEGYSNNGNNTIIIPNIDTGYLNDNKGTISLKNLKVADPNGDITITIEEEKPPTGYKKTNEKTTAILTKNTSGGYDVDKSKSSSGVSGNNNKVTVDIPNQPLINLSGNVWQDAQIGEKEVSGPNGIKDGNEEGIDNIIVELYSMKEDKVLEDKTTITDNNGDYKFENIDKTNEGYKIIFKYNGIKYNATTTEPGISKGTEPDRTEFNNDFKTISAGKSNNVEGLTYTYSDEKSVLNATVQGHTTGTTDAKFQISAETPVYTNTTDNANLGLVERYFDLAIGTDVKSATLKINDKETKYDYAQIMDGELEDLTLDKILQNNSSIPENIKYNLYLYTSDYNYRINDYKMGITNNIDSGDEGKTDNQIIAEAVDNQTINKEQELEAYVTYSVILKNQSTHKATVDEFVYYYDAAYTPYNINSTNEYDVSIDTNARKITFTSKNGGLSVNDPDYRKGIDLKFQVNKDSNGNLAIKDNCTNVGEITKYSTVEGGLIDVDSAPGNAGVTFENGTAKIGQYEDDTDQARGLKISLKDESRTITGTVFEDLNKDGVSNDNKQVKDVIVQLIEIKTINGKNREYIWQETRSGSNTVKTTARNGYPGEGYTNNVSEEGKYEFKDYIPGNYIIRYIYGDGTTYDITDNIKKYNGQDYKSTIDEHYQAEWYNKVNYKQYASVARDNEARRLKVMAYSTMIEKTNGNNLVEMNAEALEGTWMAAETSKLNVPIDSSTTPTEKSTVLYDTMNFGLALRPETKLVLEKHITGLKITPSGTGVQPIVDARANIEQVINEGKIDTTGVTTGLATIKSDRSERGFWKVETDIEELAQGAQLEVEYTYVIRNNSDEDYLNKYLVNGYRAYLNGEKPYEEYSSYEELLNGKSSEVKTNTKGQTQKYGTYLGQYYYTGNKGQNDIEVLSRVEGLEEALNNQLKYDETVAGEDFVKVNTEGAVSKNIYDTDGNLGTRNIETIVKTTSTSEFLRTVIKDSNSTEKIKWHDKTVEGVNDPVVPNADYSKTLKLTTVLTSFNNGAGYYPSYIAEITKYSNAAGRRNMSAEPANLSYVHSEDTDMTLENTWQYEIDGTTYTVQGEENIPENATNIVKLNEVDEFWGEQIIISKPTGFNKQLAIQIVIITISSIAVIGVGIVLIKKFVLKK